jgi:hypothetical protein
MVGDPADRVVRGAHERADPGVVGDVEHLDDVVDGAEAHGLRPRLLLGHVVDTEELVVTEKDAVHGGHSPLAFMIWSIVQSVSYALAKELSGAVFRSLHAATKLSTCAEYSSPRR